MFLETEMRQTKLNKPRDPHLVQMLQRKSGSHTKKYKAVRKAQKVQLKKDYFNDTLAQ